MSDTSEKRTRFNNEWPAAFLFPAEQALTQRLAKHNVLSIFFPVGIEHSGDHDFQTLLSHCIDSLDHLPLRPDLAFDQVWKALDSEFVRLKLALKSAAHVARFVAFSSHVQTSTLTSKSYLLFAPHVPLQTCEYLAKRILDSTAKPNEHSNAFTKRLASAIGKNLVDDIHAKYDAGWLTAGQEALTQRKLGTFLKRLIAGQALSIGAKNYALTADRVTQLMIGTVLPQFRNERFHGNTRPPFRSSKASLKTYLHSYFVLMYAYSLMADVFLYRNFQVTTIQAVHDNTQENIERLMAVLGDQSMA